MYRGRKKTPERAPEIRVQLNIGATGYDHKPTEREVGIIVNGFQCPETRRELTLSEIMKLVAEEGRPFTPALLATPQSDGSIAKVNACFTAQRIFALDFDNKEEIISLDETLAYAAELDLVPFGAYFTPSSTEKRPKYRVLFCMAGPVSNLRERDIIMQMFLGLFPAADPQCKEASRHFYGVMSGPVTHPLIQTGAVNSIEALTFAWQANLAQDKAHFSDKMKRFAARFGLCLQNGRIALLRRSAPPSMGKCGENAGASIYINIEQATKSPLLSNSDPTSDHISDSEGGGFPGEFFWFDTSLEDYPGDKGRSLDSNKSMGKISGKSENRNRERMERWDRVGDQLRQCELIKMLLGNTDRERPLSHGEFYHLATCFANLRGGDEVFEEALASCEYRVEKRIGQYNQIVASKAYYPQHCANSGCRFKETCTFARMPNHKSILSLKFVRGGVRQIKAPETISIEKARALMPPYYDQALRSPKKISVIRAGCGVGKTTAMIPAMMKQVKDGKKVLYVAPTHRLLNQTWGRAGKIAGGSIRIYRWADLVKHIEQSDSGLAADIKHWRATGHHEIAASQIRKWAQQQAREKKYEASGPIDLDEKARDIADYLDASAHQDDTTPALWCMTHARLVHGSVSADICFVDEDILMRNLLTVRQFNYSDLKRLYYGLQGLSCNPAHQAVEREQAEIAASSVLNLIQAVSGAGKNQVTPMPAIDFPTVKFMKDALPKPVRYSSDTEEAEGSASDLLEFLTSRSVAFVRLGGENKAAGGKVVYISRRNLPARVNKYIIASASANRWMHEAFCTADELEFVTMPDIVYKGELFLHPKKSFANSAFNRKNKERTLSLIGPILEEHPDVAVICSKTVCGGIAGIPTKESSRDVRQGGRAQ